MAMWRTLGMLDYKMYISSLKGKFFKILPLYETDRNSLKDYLVGLKEELIGFSENKNIDRFSGEIISLINIIIFFINEEYSQKTCKKNVFKCIHIIETIEIKCGSAE